jgi:hypothetical protein
MTTVTPYNMCDEKARFVSERDEATKNYSDAVASLISQVGLCSRAEYLELKRIVDHRRIAMDQASLRLAKHLSDHHCLAGPLLAHGERQGLVR